MMRPVSGEKALPVLVMTAPVVVTTVADLMRLAVAHLVLMRIAGLMLMMIVDLMSMPPGKLSPRSARSEYHCFAVSPAL